MSKRDWLRVLALGVLEHAGHLFVSCGYDPLKGEVFYRPLGGRVALGECGAQALQRGFLKSLGEPLADVRYEGLIVGLFIHEGEPGPRNEIVLLYRARFVEDALHDLTLTREVRDGDQLLGIASWQPIAAFRTRKAILYPDGLVGLLT